MKVYVSLPVYRKHDPYTEEEVIAYGSYLQKEIINRGFNLVLDPIEADVIYFPPNYDDYNECMDEYNQFKDYVHMVFYNLNELYEVEEIIGDR